MADRDRPHFALPFRWEPRGDGTLSAADTEQDSSEEIADCIELALRTEQGERNSLPEFGRPQPLEFALDRELARAQLRQTLEATEPRAIHVVQGADIDPQDPGLMRLQVMFAQAEEE